MGHGATKGVFITTSRYTRDAIEYAEGLAQIKIILIDGTQLAKLMIDNNIGVSPEGTYTVKTIDSDHFHEIITT